ncbi:MAG: hypothetical protein KGL02_09710, partial [Acidobacteriota bacterium]|nr:hypothetical protein [Acidobacteriota bacterium]
MCSSVGLAILAFGLVLAHARPVFPAPAPANSRKLAGSSQSQAPQPDPWTTQQTVEPAALAKEITGPASGRPVVVCVSPHALYLGGHIPGAVYQGPGFNAE